MITPPSKSFFVKIPSIIALFLFLVLPNLVLANTSSNVTSTFPDIQQSPFSQQITSLKNKGLIGGYDDRTFQPNRELTRGEMAKFAVNALGVKFSEDCKNSGSNFDDNKKSDTFYQYIKTLQECEIISGYSDKTFRPNAKITNAEASKFIFNSILHRIKQNGGDVPDIFKIANSELDETFDILESVGVIEGAFETKVDKNGLTKREDFAKFISEANRVLLEETKAISGNYQFDKNTYNCGDLPQKEMLEVYTKSIEIVGFDVNNFDADFDGKPCEDKDKLLEEKTKFAKLNCQDVEETLKPIYNKELLYKFPNLDLDKDGVGCEAEDIEKQKEGTNTTKSNGKTKLKCSDFTNQITDKEILRLNPRLDQNKDGIGCEGLPV